MPYPCSRTPSAVFPTDSSLSLYSYTASCCKSLSCPDKDFPLPSGGDGLVYSWDMRTRRCLGQMVDCGNRDSAALALSSDGRYLATGSASGVVNVYGQDQCWARGGGERAGLQRPANPTPLKEVMNLTTTVDKLTFSPDGQILVSMDWWGLQAFI